MADRPNFVFFITDQHRADFLGSYGHPVLKTPNIDALAETGLSFDRFYVASPVCMPNRASLVTCRMPSSHGVRSNGIPLSRRNVTFVEQLRDAGYDTALIGKSHLQNFTGKPPLTAAIKARPGFHREGEAIFEAVSHDLGGPDYGFEEPDFWSVLKSQVPTPFYGFDHVELVTGHGDGVGGDYRSWLLEREPNAERLLGEENQLAHDYVCPQAVRTALPEELYSTTYIAERAESWLRSRKGSDRPFFLMVSFPDPHHPFNPPGRFWDMYHPRDMDQPGAFACPDWTPPPHVAGIFETRNAGGARLDGMGTIGCTEREALEARALTCGMISMIDGAVGRVQEALDHSGRKTETVVTFTTDHGDHLGDHRLLLKGAEQYEQITRVPLIWSDPEGPTGERTDAIGQTHDIGVTILERAKVEPAFGMQGRMLGGLGGAGREFAFIQYDHQKTNPGIGLEPRIHTIRDRNWRLSVVDGEAWGELYDLVSDPQEIENLWSEPVASKDKARLMEILVRAEMATIDRSPRPTGLA